MLDLEVNSNGDVWKVYRTAPDHGIRHSLVNSVVR